MMARRIIRYLALSLIVVLIVMIATLLTCHLVVVENTRTKTSDSIDSVSNAEVGLLLGTTPQTRISGRKNIFFKNRIDAAEELYKAHKIKFVLISGDENSLDGVNEPECMKDSLVARGVPASVIILDGKGYRTINSIVNANKVFGLKSFTIISQQFHNERALYQAEHLGLDVENLQAYNARNPKSKRALITYAREYLARVKMFWDLLISKESESSPNTILSFLGKPIIINNSICEQISAIAAQDEMLSYSDSILQIGNVRWRVNLDLPNIVLFTSVQPDDPKMKQVVKYLNSIYGKPYQDDEDGYSIKWSSSDDSLDINRPGSTLVHLRRVHSEEGGTFLFIK